MEDQSSAYEPSGGGPTNRMLGDLRSFHVRRLNSDRIRRSKGFRDGALDAGCGVGREAILTAFAKGLERAHQAIIALYDQV